MTEIQPFDRPVVYRIRINTHLGDEWSEWFEGLNIMRDPSGETSLCGMVADQAALYGLLKKARDMGLGLISVTRVECDVDGSKGGSGAELDVCGRCPLGTAARADQQD
jgi:hypothetical protein